MWKTKAAAPHRAAAFLVVLDDLECAPRCSGHNQWKDFFKFRGSETPADVSEPHFHEWGREGERQMPRYPFRLAASRQATFPKGTAELPQSKPDGFAKGPISEGAVAVGDWGSFIPRCAALSQKAARQLPFSSTTPPVKMQCRSVRRRSGIALLKIIFPLSMRRAKRSALKSFTPRQVHCQESTALSSTLSSTASCKAFSILRCAP